MLNNLRAFTEAGEFRVKCECCGKKLNSKTVKIGMGKKKAYSFKCKECSTSTSKTDLNNF